MAASHNGSNSVNARSDVAEIGIACAIAAPTTVHGPMIQPMSVANRMWLSSRASAW